MNPWIDTLNQTLKMSVEAQEALSNAMKSIEIEKDGYLVNEGQICRKLFFIEKGCVRGFYYKDGKEISHWFGFEGDFVTSFNSFIQQKSSFEYLQSIENSTFWSISYSKLYELYDQYPEIERVGRITCEQYYIRLEERYVGSQFQTASDRYGNLVTHNPGILQRVPLGYIASFLGISQETLSRVRSKYS